MTFVDTILFHAKAIPDKPAIILLDRTVTFGMLGDAIPAVAHRVQANGIKAGDIVGIQVENPIRHLAIAYALIQCGVIGVSVRGDQLADMPAMGGSALITDQQTGPAHGFRRILIEDGWFAPAAAAFAPVRFADEDSIFRLSLTSGTTGQSKAIPHTLRQFHALISLVAPIHWSCGADRSLVLIGLSSYWSFAEATRCLWAGRTVCFAASAPEALRMISLFSIGALYASPQQLRVVIDSYDQAPIACPSLQFVSVAGSQFPKQLAAEVRSKLCSRIVINYGSTEAGKTAMSPLDQTRGIPGAAGFVMPWVEAEILDEQGNVLPHGQEGALRIRTDGGGKPYQPGTKVLKPAPEWFYPGDRARIEANGMLVIVGRVNEVINTGGLKISPEMVEQLVSDRVDVADAAAVGIVGPGGLEEIWLAVVPRGTADVREVLAHCQRKAPALAPKHVRIVTRIERNDFGKVAREKLRDQLINS